MPSLIAVLGLNTGPFKTAAGQAQAMASSLGHHIATSIGGLIGLGGGIVGMEQVIEKTIEWGSHIEDTSAKLGMNVKETQLLDFALKLSGSSIEQASKFFVQFAVNRDKALRGNEEMIRHFKNLGLSIDDLKQKRFFEAFLAIGDAVHGGDPQKLFSDLKAIGGKGAKEMTAAFVRGLPDMIRGIDGTLAIVDQSVIASLKHTGDQVATVKAKGQGFFAAGFAGLKDIVLPSIFTTADSAETFRRLKAEYEARGQELGERTEKLTGGETADERFARANKDKSEHWKKAHKHAQEILKTAREIHHLHEEASKTRFEAHLKELSKEEKVAEITKRLGELRLKMAKLHGVDRAKADVEVAKTEKELTEAKHIKSPHASHDLNSLQSIGGMYVASPLEMSALEVARRSEAHLRDLKEHFKGAKTGWNNRHH